MLENTQQPDRSTDRATDDRSDTDLLCSYVAAGSDEAFGALVRRYVNLVYSAALRQVGNDAHLAQEVTQTVFTSLARKAASLSRHPVLSGWLYRSTRFAAIDALRTKQRRHKYENEAATMNALSADDAGETDWVAVRPVVDSMLAQLSERDRDAVLLRFFEGRSFSEVAATLKLSEDGARMRVNRALDQVRALLARRGIKSSSAALAVALTSHAVTAAPAGLAAAVTTTALAGVAVGGSAAGAFVLFQFMSSTKAITTIAAAITLLAVGTAVVQTNESRATAVTAGALRTERDDLRVRLAAMEQRVEQSTQELAAQHQEVAALRANTSAPKPAEVAAARPVETHYGSSMDYVLLHAEAQPAYLEQQRLRAQARFSRFFQETGLTAGQQDQFLKEIQEAAAAELDFMAAMRAEGWGVGNLPKDPEALQQFQSLLAEQKNAKATSANKLRTLLGETGYQQLQQYAGTIPERNVADQLAGRVYATDTPLSVQQADELARVLAQHRFAPQPEPSPSSSLNGVFISLPMFQGRMGQAMQQSGMSQLDWAAPVTDAAIARAEAVLSPPQLVALRQIQAQQALEFQLAPPPPGAAQAPAGP